MIRKALLPSAAALFLALLLAAAPAAASPGLVVDGCPIAGPVSPVLRGGAWDAGSCRDGPC